MWRTAKGEWIRIVEMSQSHLENAYNYCKRTGVNPHGMELLRQELYIRWNERHGIVE